MTSHSKNPATWRVDQHFDDLAQEVGEQRDERKGNRSGGKKSFFTKYTKRRQNLQSKIWDLRSGRPPLSPLFSCYAPDFVGFMLRAFIGFDIQVAIKIWSPIKILLFISNYAINKWLDESVLLQINYKFVNKFCWIAFDLSLLSSGSLTWKGNSSKVLELWRILVNFNCLRLHSDWLNLKLWNFIF